MMKKLGDSGTLAIFAISIFVSAALLFMVQPMIAKMILPRMGGAAQVWAFCMVFFQSLLLIGYLYTWVFQRFVANLRTQLIVHVVVVGAAFISLPLALKQIDAISVVDSPMLWLGTALGLTVGLPFFVTSTTSPLLQAWFARTGHPQSGDPYHLYAASNLGSMLSLLGYSLLLEPMAHLQTNSLIWTVGYGLFAALIGAIIFLLWGMTSEDGAQEQTSDGDAGDDGDSEGEGAGAPERAEIDRVFTPKLALTWVMLGAIPSSMLIGATQYLTTDIASVPFLWIIPLVLYLISFVFAFAKRQVLSRSTWTQLAYLTAPITLLLAIMATGVVMLHLPAALVGLFLFAMTFHGRLVELRPRASELTAFYVAMSLGGVLGGLFNGIIAPIAFNGFYEYMLVCALAVLALPEVHLEAFTSWSKPKIAGAVSLALVSLAIPMAAMLRTVLEFGAFEILGFIVLLICAVVMVRAQRVGKIILLSVGALVFFLNNQDQNILHQERSFYGTLKVVEKEGVHVIFHGSTVHGAQRVGSTTPLTYHWPKGPAGDVFGKLLEEKATVGIVGVGAGAMCGYWRPGDHYDLYEINPAVVHVAQDEKFFTYMKHCGEPDVILGDGRIRVEQQPDGRYDLITIDAFNSDSIPTHLLTLEAAELYFKKLTKDGILLLHVSNRYLFLNGVVGKIAEELGVEVRVRSDKFEDLDKETVKRLEGLGSRWCVLTRDKDKIKQLDATGRWHKPSTEDAPLWTDTHTSLLPIFILGERFESKTQ